MATSIVQGLSLTADAQSSSSAKILPVDVYGAQESTTTFQVAEGIAAGYSEKHSAKPREAEVAVRSGLAVQTK